MNARTQAYAEKVQEQVAEFEGVALDDVHVKVVADGEYYLPIVTVETENGIFRGKWHDGESYSDIRWEEV